MLGGGGGHTHMHGHMENINVITNSKQRVTDAATQPRAIQSEQLLTPHPPKR